jgi:hypothetical protein
MQEPTQNEINDALVSVSIASGIPLIEETIGPAEVHTPFADEYVTMPRSVWVDTCRRAINGERGVKMLQERCDGLYLQIEAHEVVGAAKDADYEALELRAERAEQINAEWLGVFIAWVAAAGLAMIAGCM